jgi:hypothetical protein
MSFPQVLEVVIGLVFIYYILGSVVSTVTQIINESMESRGAALEMYLKKAVGDKTLDITSLPQIKALRPVRYANWWNVFGAGTEEKRVEKIPVSTLVTGFFDVSGLNCKGDVSAQELLAIINQLPEGEAKHAMASWVQQGVTDINEIRNRSLDYFNGILNQAQATFKARARSVVIILSLLVTLILGTDSIQIAQDLWSDAGLRNSTAAAATSTVAQQQQGNITAAQAAAPSPTALALRFSWIQSGNFPTTGGLGSQAGFVLLKILGLIITAVAVSQGSSFWYDLLKKLTGQNSQPQAAADGGDGS